MATGATVSPKATRTTITREDVSEEKRLERSKYYKETDFWELVAEMVGKDGHLARVYRADDRWENAASPVDNKLTEPFTEETIYQRFGGGRYNIWLYRGASLVRPTFHLEIEGLPKSPAAQMAAATGVPAGVDGATAVSLEAMRMASNPDFMRMQAQLFFEASKQAIEMMRAQMPPAQSPLEILRAAKEIFGAGPSQAAPAANPVMDLITTTVLPALVQRLLTPGDPLESIKSVSAILAAVKDINGGNVKSDWANTLLASLPALGEKVVNGLHEYRLASESQERAFGMQRAANPHDPRVITVQDGPAPPNGAPAVPPQAPANPAATVAHPGSNAWFAIKIEAGILNPNASGTDLYHWIASCHEAGLMPEAAFEALTLSAESAVAMVQQLFNEVWGPDSEHLKKIMAEPRLRDFVTEYIAAAALDRTPDPAAPPATPKPN